MADDIRALVFARSREQICHARAPVVLFLRGSPGPCYWTGGSTQDHVENLREPRKPVRLSAQVGGDLEVCLGSELHLLEIDPFVFCVGLGDVARPEHNARRPFLA